MPTYTYYKASVRAKCWKQHTCSACGCVYRYKFEQSAEATGGLPEMASEAARKKVTEGLKSGSKPCPCPCCGLVQPDMVARSKLLWHSILACVPLVLLIFILPAMDQTMSRQVAACIAVAVAGAVALGHLLVAVDNPNWSRAQNKQSVERDVAGGRVQVIRQGAGTDLVAPPWNFGFSHFVFLLMVCAGAGAFLLPEYVFPMPAVPTNPDLKPTVIVPGSEVTVTMNSKMDTVSGLWRGTPEVTVLNPEEVGGLKNLTASSNHATWGNSMRIRSSEKHMNVNPWVKLNLPNDPALTGKTIKLRVMLSVNYPSAHTIGSGKTFRPVADKFGKTVTIVVANTADHQQAQGVWLGCCLGGLLASLLGGCGFVLLAVHLRSRAEPSEVIPLGPEDELLALGMPPPGTQSAASMFRGRGA
jgi:hypothetical protein